MSSIFWGRARGAVGLFLLVNALALLVWLSVGAYLLSASVDGSIAGWTGSPIEQVVWYAIGSTLYTTTTFGLPVLVAVLIVLAVAERRTPR